MAERQSLLGVLDSTFEMTLCANARRLYPCNLFRDAVTAISMSLFIYLEFLFTCIKRGTRLIKARNRNQDENYIKYISQGNDLIILNNNVNSCCVCICRFQFL